MIDRYLCIDPSGDLRWITVPNVPSNEGLRREKFCCAIGCEWLEQVCTCLRDIVIIVDECGKIKEHRQPWNPVASRLYAGTLFGDPIVGPAVVAAIHLVEGPDGFLEYDWVPLSAAELAKLSSFLGVHIPDIN